LLEPPGGVEPPRAG